MNNITIKTTAGATVTFNYKIEQISIQKSNDVNVNVITFSQIKDINCISSDTLTCTITLKNNLEITFSTYDLALAKTAVDTLSSMLNSATTSLNSNGNSNFITVFATIFVCIGFIGSIILAASLNNVLLFFAAIIAVLYFGYLLYALGVIIAQLNRIDNNTRKQ